MRISTCSPQTTFASVVWALNACPTPRLSNPNVLQTATDAGCDKSAGVASAPMITINYPTPGTLYIFVEGSGSASGAAWVQGCMGAGVPGCRGA